MDKRGMVVLHVSVYKNRVLQLGVIKCDFRNAMNDLHFKTKP